jgi:DNA polymerase-3 subunit delta'
MVWPAFHGHGAQWARLEALLGAGRLPHALLFSGPPGIGKALLARRLAGRIACTDAAHAPCGECAGCRQVLAGTHPDLLLVSAPDRTRKAGRKKEIGIEQARELKRFAQLQPAVAARKVAIVDDADRLSIAAQNALLKTLEEPPGHAVIMLVTASPGALLPTVRSRCQRVVCQPLADAEVEAALTAAGVAAETAAALAALAEGSPGRALAQRDGWGAAEREAMATLLADLTPGRYGSVLAMSKGLGSNEAETAARLDGLLEFCRTAAQAAVAANDRDALDVALRRAAAVEAAARTLRWRNPNRVLLTEALALQLARA